MPPPPLEGEEPKPESKLSWHVWAKVCPGMQGEYLSLTSPGEVTECDDSWPILAFRQNAAIQLPGLNAESLAKRVAACINFCAGVDLDSVGHPSLKELIRSIDDPSAQARREVNSIWPFSSNTTAEDASG